MYMMLNFTHIRQSGWLEAGKVREKHPVPASQQNILRLNVTMTDLLSVTLFQDFEQLEYYPLLLHCAKEGTSAERGRGRGGERKKETQRERKRERGGERGGREGEVLY